MCFIDDVNAIFDPFELNRLLKDSKSDLVDALQSFAGNTLSCAVFYSIDNNAQYSQMSRYNLYA